MTRLLPLHTLVLVALAAACSAHNQALTLAGDWDAYVALGSVPRGGFEGWRRMGFAHFATADSGFVGAIRRRTGEPILAVSRVTAQNDSLVLADDGGHALSAAWRQDTLSGVMLDNGKPAGRRIRLVRRATAFVPEQNYPLWPGAV
jgi:hypothetical protein